MLLNANMDSEVVKRKTGWTDMNERYNNREQKHLVSLTSQTTRSSSGRFLINCTEKIK